MDINKFTIKAQEAIQASQQLAIQNEQATVEPAHILQAIYKADENLLPFILKKMGVDRQCVFKSS